MRYVGTETLVVDRAECSCRRHLPGRTHSDFGGQLLANLPEVADADGQRVEVSTVDKFYEFECGTDVVAPSAAVATKVAAVEDALAAGYSGFHAVVDAASVVRTAELRSRLRLFEFLIDQKMNTLPVAAVCAMTSVLSVPMRPPTRVPAPVRRSRDVVVPSSCRRTIDVRVDRRLDMSCMELFATAIERVLPITGLNGEIVIDGSGLTFIDHRALLALEHRLA